ncbi:MAG: ABC transporter permease, partial [Phycisphaerales bacterium]|nr:ABC transporter permease [Phycisphaerales bacterium]
MTSTKSHSTRASIARLFEHWGVLVAFVLLFGASTWMQGSEFASVENFRNLFNQNAAVGILAIGMTLVIVSGGIDLSVGSIVVLAAAFGLTLTNEMLAREWNETTAVVVGVAASILSGMLAGSINGALIVFGRLAPFIATLGGLVAFRSIALAMADAGEIRSASSSVFAILGRGGIPFFGFENTAGKALTITYATMLFLAIALVFQWFLSRSRYGRQLVAVGANETAARYAGVSVASVRLRTYVIMGALAGVAGLLQSSRMNSVSTSQLGLGIELDAIAAVVIGGTSLRGGFGRVWGTVIGVLILGMIANMITISGISPYWSGAVKGAVI